MASSLGKGGKSTGGEDGENNPKHIVLISAKHMSSLSS
jgi:hypothetical protein